jgi:hypothetical protein
MKQAVKSCKSAVENVLKVLRPHSMAIDAEFSVVPEALLRLLKSTFSYSKLESSATPEITSLMMRLSDLVSTYNSQLERLHKDTQGFLRNIQSPRLHHPLFIRNTLIFQTLTAIIESIQSVQRSRFSRHSNNASKPTPTCATISTAFAQCDVDVGLEDPAAAKFWINNWPSDVCLSFELS